MRISRWMGFCAIVVFTWGCIDRPEIPDTNLQLQADIETIDNYLSENGISAIQDKTGIRLHVDVLGTGLPPRAEQTVRVNYRGALMNGFVFDAGGDAVEVVDEFIDGWRAALVVMPAGTKGVLYVPSPLGYGNQTVGSIPPNSILVFDIHLKEVLPTNAEKARLVSDIEVIDNYLAQNSISAVKDTTGIRYVIAATGTGPVPGWYDKVRFAYSGKNLSTGAEFFSGTGQPTDEFDSRMIDYLHGIKIGLSKINVGGKITIYVPSGLAFGPFENGPNLPPNTIVIYTIELQEIY